MARNSKSKTTRSNTASVSTRPSRNGSLSNSTPRGIGLKRVSSIMAVKPSTVPKFTRATAIKADKALVNKYDPSPSPAYVPTRTADKKIKTEKHRPLSFLSLMQLSQPDARKSSVKARERLTCKKRPDSKKAASKRSGGGAKTFVPWCG